LGVLLIELMLLKEDALMLVLLLLLLLEILSGARSGCERGEMVTEDATSRACRRCGLNVDLDTARLVETGRLLREDAEHSRIEGREEGGGGRGLIRVRVELRLV
jgi:hypothetical protein